MTELGIFARTFSRPSLSETLDAVAATGLRTMQFNMKLAGGASAAAIRAEVSERGLRMAAVSGTFNMAHPDPAARADGLRWLEALVAADLGTSTVTLCTGTRDATDMWRRHPDNGTPEAWRDMRASVEAALPVAEAHGVTLAFEPEHSNVVDSAAAARRLLDEVRSPHLKVVLDPANLADREARTLREAFELLGDDIVLAHAKDVRGGVDYALYLELLGDEVPLILHGMPEEEVPGSLEFIRSADARS